MKKIMVPCSHCGGNVIIKGEHLGYQIKCPSCQMLFNPSPDQEYVTAPRQCGYCQEFGHDKRTCPTLQANSTTATPAAPTKRRIQWAAVGTWIVATILVPLFAEWTGISPGCVWNLLPPSWNLGIGIGCLVALVIVMAIAPFFPKDRKNGPKFPDSGTPES
jgi:phage FluMu protein Com